jgi:hypothetical protein
VTQCDVIVKTVEGGVEKGYTSANGALYTPDDGGPAILEATLRAKADPAGAAQSLTYTAVPPGAGVRMGIDRDEDQILNGLDNCPGAANGPGGGTCIAGDAPLLGLECLIGTECGAAGVCSIAQEDGDSNLVGDACEPSIVPEPSGLTMLTVGISALLGLSRRRTQRAHGR